MTTKTEALKLALEALGKSEPLPTEDDDDYAEAGWRRHKQAITAIEAALAQPEPKPNTTRPCRSCGGTGLRDTGIGEAPTAICKPCDGTGQIAIAAQPEQEPVACVIDGDLYFHHEIDWEDLVYQGHGVELLYTSPPKRELVGLTFDEKYELAYYETDPYEIVNNTEAKLKEKNA